MKSNLGMTDRFIRVFIAIAAVILYFTNVTTGTFGIVLMAVGGILAITSFINYCPIYAILGLNSKPKSKAETTI